MRYIAAIVVAFFSFTGTALAAASVAAAVPPDGSVLDLAKPVFDAVIGGHPLLAGALALVLLVTLARSYAPKAWKLDTDAGGTALTFLGSLGTAVAAAIAAGTLPGWGLMSSALVFAASASGGYTAMRRLAVPVLRWVESKVPAKIRPLVSPLFNIVLWAFERSGAQTIAKAEAAGEAAVQAKPAEGAAGTAKIGKSFP